MLRNKKLNYNFFIIQLRCDDDMMWLFFIKVKNDILNVILTNIKLERFEIKSFKYNLDNIQAIELDILQCFNNIIAVKDKIYIVCENEYKKDDLINKSMGKLSLRITDMIDYHSFKILIKEFCKNDTSGVLKLIDDNLNDKTSYETIKN